MVRPGDNLCAFANLVFSRKEVLESGWRGVGDKVYLRRQAVDPADGHFQYMLDGSFDLAIHFVDFAGLAR